MRVFLQWAQPRGRAAAVRLCPAIAPILEHSRLLVSVPSRLRSAVDSCSGRVIKAALAAGFYPSLLRVEHPPARFRATEGGSVQVTM